MNFLRTNDLLRGELEAILEDAMRFKKGGEPGKPLAGSSVGLVFFNPSLRTRTSMQIAINDLGGNPVVLEPGGNAWAVEYRDGAVMDGDKAEHLKEFIGVLEQYVSAIGVRTFAQLNNWEEEMLDPVLSAIEKIAAKPVINLESAMHHPCQSLADAMTIREKFGEAKKKVLLTWAWHPKPLPMAVPNSFALAAAQFGHDLTIARPEGFDLDAELMDEIAEQANLNGGSLSVTDDPDAAYEGAQVVYAKSWGSSANYGNPEREVREREKYRGKWIVDEAKMANTDDAIFMHCLPVRRNVVVTDGVIDSPSSVVLQQAVNRLHVAKAILARVVNR
jgi:N-acetylornithine carbamoyltransferase